MTDALCEQCGAPFSGKRSDAKYCSNRCGSSARSKRHYDANPEKFSDKREALHRTDRVKGILSRVKSRARKDGIPFSLTEADISIPEVCPILGLTLVHKVGKGYSPSSPSLDKIRPELGYVPGNVRIISARANLLKSNATELELAAVLSDLRNLQRAGKF